MIETVVAAQVESERTTLVRRARAGEHGAFDILVRPELGRHLRFALSLLGDEADARDVVQDACLKAWCELPRLRDPERFDAWFGRIVVNAARDRLRHRRRMRVREVRPSIGDDDRAAGAVATGGRAMVDDHAEAEAIRRAFDRLDPDRRILLVLHHVEGRPVADIASSLGIPVGTVKWRLSAARTALQRALEDERR